MPPAEIREKILAAAIALVREQGLPGLTQPRVARATGISQSHLTYYFPTRADLLHAVLARAAAGQRAGIEAAIAAADGGTGALARELGKALSRAENTRVLASFVLAADRDPTARALFRELSSGMRTVIAGLMPRIGITPSPGTARMVHALGTGLAILALALGEPARRDTEKTLAALFRLLAEHHRTDTDSSGGP